MRMKEDHMMNGQLKPAYNLQIGTENQFVLHYDIFPNPTDTGTLIPFIESAPFLPKQIIADAGYGSQENLEYLDNIGIDHLIKYAHFEKKQKRKFKMLLTSSKNRHFLPISFPQILLDKIRHLFLIKNSLPMFHSITFIVHLNKLNPMKKAIQNRCCDPFIA